MTFSNTRIALAFTALALAAAPAVAQDTTGISSAQVDDLDVVDGSDLAKFQAKTLGEDIQDAVGIQDPVSFNHVGFIYTGGSQPIEVEGLVLDVGDDLRVERYEVFEVEPNADRPGDQGMTALEQAMTLADHDRADSDERRVVEVRGGRIVILSGPGAVDAAAVNAIRPLVWKARGSDWPVNLLSVQEGDDDMAFFTDAAGSQHESVQRALDGLDDAAVDQFRSMGATVTKSATGVRVELDSMLVIERRSDADGSTTLTMSETVAGERAVSETLKALVAENPAAAPAPAAALNGASGALGGLFGN